MSDKRIRKTAALLLTALTSLLLAACGSAEARMAAWLGTETVAEGWLDNAVKFWERNSN